MTHSGHGSGGALLPRRHVRTHFDGGESMSPLLRHLLEASEAASRFQATGEVVRVIGTTVEAAGLILQLGSICWIDLEPEGMVSAEVVGFKDGLITLVPFGDLSGVRPGSAVRLREQQFRVPIGPAVLGRVLGRIRPPAGRPGTASCRVQGSDRRGAASSRTRPHLHPDLNRRPRPGRVAVRRQGPAARYLRGLRRGQVHAARDDRAPRFI